MFDLRDLEENFEDYLTAWAKRGIKKEDALVAALPDELKQRKHLIQKKESLLAERNQASQNIAQKKKQGQDASSDIEAQKSLGSQIKEVEQQAQSFEEKLTDRLSRLPNTPHHSVPEGASEEENQEVRKWGEPPHFSFQPLSHEVLGEKRGWMNFERAAKLTGSRFSVLTGFAAKLERVLIQFMLDIQSQEHDYIEVVPPFIVNDKTLYGTGNLPRFKKDLFQLDGYPYYLIPTAEVPLSNLHAGEILKEKELPKYYTAYTPCFRSEAGSYGKDLKGLIRQHQFNKVELVKISHPDTSDDEHEKMVQDAEKILQRLEIPYRVMLLCGGEMGSAAAKAYDIEVWLPSQQCYREISSVSNCQDYQARRMGTRFRSEQGKPRYVHTLNGSGLAVGRTLIAILENYQMPDAKVRVPLALQPYFQGQEVI